MAKFNGLVGNIEDNRNKATQITENSTHIEYPSALAVKDYIDDNDNGFIKRDGSVTMADDLNMGGNAINGCKALVITQAPSSAGSIDRFVGNVGFNDTRYLKQTDKVTSISSSSTDAQIPSAKAVKDYVDEHGGSTTETAYEIVASESGTSEFASTLTVNLSKPCKEIMLAINIPPPPSNLAYCQASFHTVGDDSFTISTNVSINASHTKAGLCFFEVKAGADGLRVTSASTANIGKTYAQIQNEAVATNSGGYTGYVGRTFNYQDETDYYIDRFVLRPTGSTSGFAAGTNYIVWGR